MQIPLNDRLQFLKKVFSKHLGLLVVSSVFIILGFVLITIGYYKAESNFLIGFGITFITVTGSILLYTMPSSFKYYYEQEITKKYGSYAYAIVIDKKTHDYSHTSNSFEGGKLKHYEEYLYAVEFQYTYNNETYSSECFFEEKSTFDLIYVNAKLPIQFLKHNPSKVKVRRRKLSKELGIPEKLCD